LPYSSSLSSKYTQPTHLWSCSRKMSRQIWIIYTVKPVLNDLPLKYSDIRQVVSWYSCNWYEMQCEGQLKSRLHNTSYCLIEVVTKAGLTVLCLCTSIYITTTCCGRITLNNYMKWYQTFYSLKKTLNLSWQLEYDVELVWYQASIYHVLCRPRGKLPCHY
jgi:hypothetical protein